MDTDRFEALADAYGADLRRWPAAERTAAAAVLSREPAARAILDAAGRLDAALDDWRVAAPSPALRDRVLQSAPRARRVRASAGIGLWMWLSGAGFAAAAVAGVIVGVTASDAALYDVRADQVLSAAAPDEAGQNLTPYSVGVAGSAQA